MGGGASQRGATPWTRAEEGDKGKGRRREQTRNQNKTRAQRRGGAAQAALRHARARGITSDGRRAEGGARTHAQTLPASAAVALRCVVHATQTRRTPPRRAHAARRTTHAAPYLLRRCLRCYSPRASSRRAPCAPRLHLTGTGAPATPRLRVRACWR
jgi:hypothetical protein